MVFKAWFSTPERPCAATGKDTSGAYGFFSAFLMILNDHRPTHVALTLDTGAPTFRHELFPQYKAHRPPPDPEILEQFPMVKSIMQAFRVPVLELEGFEADDLIGTLCALAENEGIETLIVTKRHGPTPVGVPVRQAPHVQLHCIRRRIPHLRLRRGRRE